MENSKFKTRESGAEERTLLEGLSYYLAVLWRHRILIAGVTGVATMATFAFCLASVKLPPERSPLPNLYKAEATILVQQSGQNDISTSILAALGMTQSQATGAGSGNGDLIIEVLRSRWLVDSLVSEYGVAAKYGITKNVKGESRNAVLARSTFAYASNTGALHISYEDIDPVFAKNMVNKMVSLLDQWFSQNRGMERQRLRQSLEDKLAEVKVGIGTLQNRLKSLQKKYGVLDAQELGVSQAASIANLRSQLILKDVEIKNYSSFSKVDDPRLEQLKEERQNLLDLIAQNQQELPEAQKNPGDIADAPGSPQKSLADVAQEFSQLNLELDIQQRIYNTLSPQYEAAKLAPEAEPIFQILELADVPDIKSGPDRLKIISVAFAGSLFFSIALSLSMNAIAALSARIKKKTTGRAAPAHEEGRGG